MSSTRKPPSDLPPVDIDNTMTDPTLHGPGTVSRRDFLAATAATGIALGAGTAAAAVSQQAVGPKPENALPKDQPEIYR